MHLKPYNAGMKLGRNDPCLCGSGRKFKHCCLNKQGWVQTPADLTWRRIRKQLDGLSMRMLEFVGRAYGSVAIVEAWEAFTLWNDEADAFDAESPHLPVFMPWFLHCWSPEPGETDVMDERLHEVVPAQAWLDDKTTRAGPMLRAYVLSCIEHPFSFYEVTRVERGRGMSLLDLITGEQHDVLERSATHSLAVHDMVYAQLACVDGVTLAEALGPTPFPPDNKVPVIELRQRIREHPSDPADNEASADPRVEWDVELRDLYLALTDRLLYRAMPTFVTSEGDAWEFHKLVYDIDSAQIAFDALKSLDTVATDSGAIDPNDVEHDADGHLRRAHVHWYGPAEGDAQSRTVVGSIDIDGNRLTAEINSRNRVARFKDIVKARLAGHATFRADKIETLEQVLANAPRESASSANASEDATVQALVADHLRKHYTEWIDMPIPMLDDRTPREVACTPDGLEQVEALLEGAENIDMGLPAATRKAIFDDIREQLVRSP